ncbi:MAG: DUF7010 family protein [Parvularculaceae bacterium]
MAKREATPLEAALKAERIGQYIRLRGGYPVPLAGAIYWAALGALGYSTDLAGWANIAFPASGLIFPLALVLAAVFRKPFMKDRSAVGGVMLPAFISMLLFWVFIVAAIVEAPALVPLLLAVGMSLHWPVIGWSYGRTLLYSAHAVVRALLALYIFIAYPEHRLTWLPFSVALVYLATIAAIYVDSGRLAKKAAT